MPWPAASTIAPSDFFDEFICWFKMRSRLSNKVLLEALSKKSYVNYHSHVIFPNYLKINVTKAEKLQRRAEL
ncbi:MAG: hypothetical protein ACO23H_17105, partial [Alphaproteobacteria bacterium]